MSGYSRPGSRISSEILAGDLKEEDRANAALNLLMLLRAQPTFADFLVAAMPQEDLTYGGKTGWLKMVEENFATYQQNYDFDAPSSPYRQTEAEYIFGRG
jgi:hypothetical protein